MSVYPVNLDTASFPGYPYSDYTQYETADQANSWVEAMQAIEETIGFGAPGTQYYPLYSRWYSTTYPTITARIDALEGIVEKLPEINTQDNIIQPVGALGVPCQAGHSGLLADAAHVHSDGIPLQSTLQIGAVFGWPAEANTYPIDCYACNGQFLSTSIYTTLFNIIGTKYNNPSNLPPAGSFAMPNYNDKFLIGAGGTYAPNAGSTGGSASITAGNLPPHGHPASISDPGHQHETWISEAGPGYQGIYLTNQQPSTLILPGINLPAVYYGQYASWSPGNYPWDPGHQNHWAPAASNISVSVGNTGGAVPYNPAFVGIHWLMRVL